MTKYRRFLLPILLAVAATLPGLYLRMSGRAAHVLHAHATADLSQVIMVTLFAGLAILGASFLLLWACDAAQMDISQTLALAVVALIAVLPEYAVDMYFTWQAGKFPQADYAHYAIANMTGANRLIIGLAWVLIVAIFWAKTRRAVRLGTERRTELAFLGMATAYAFVIPFKGTLAWYDGLVFLGLYIWYIAVAGRRPCVECEIDGPAEYLVQLPKTKRRLATLVMFLFAAGSILANAEPFSEGLIATGTQMQINKFLLVQWLAPIASEAPEFIVAIMFALRGQASMALGSLLSSKLNQWTLLVGMIPGVYGVSSGSFSTPIPMGSFQMHEILLTAAQSLLAVVLLANLRLSIGQGMLLFGLFIGQFVAPTLVQQFPVLSPLGLDGDGIHQVFSAMYIAIAISLLLDHPQRMKGFWQGLKFTTGLHQPPHTPVEGQPPTPTEESRRMTLV